MTSRQRIRSRTRSRGPSPKGGRWLWELAGVDPIAIAQDGKVVVDSLPAIGTDVKAGAVVTRIIGNWFAKPDVSDRNANMVFAIYIQNNEAFQASAAPEMQTDLFQYMFYDSAPMYLPDVVSGGNNSYTIREIDVRIKRKFRTGEDVLVFQRENISVDTTAITAGFNCRVLLRIP